MAVGRSSADPAKLAQFSSATLEALGVLRVRSDAVTRDLDALGSAGGDVPGLGSVAADLTDLVTDWEHLGAFALDVANGFYWLLGEVGYQGGVVTFADTRLAGSGTIGYADRDEAVAAAEAMAASYRRLLDGGYDALTPEAVWDVLHLADRGRYDPAFAVAFSEAVGVEGYADLTAMVRTAYTRPAIHDPVPGAGLDGVEVLATTLSTALATLPGLPPGEGSSATAGWTRRQRLDPDFLDDLAGGFDPEEGRYNTDFPLRTNTDLAVLVGFTAPPTSVAVTIANGRLSPLLRDHDRFDARPGDEGDDWGARGGRITGYATMLARDPDASALWLDDEVGERRNLDLVLQRNPDGVERLDVDGGRTLAEVVEHGVTHRDDTLRVRLMERSIEVIGGRQDEIRNPHLPDALARGVAENMDVIDRMVNDGWDPHLGEDPARTTRNTHDFMAELVKDDSARDRVAVALEEYSLDRFRQLGPPLVDANRDDLFDRTAGLERVGHVQGVFLTAQSESLYDSVEDYLAAQEQQADSLNLMIGVFPYGERAEQVIGPLNDVLDVHGISAGELTAAEAADEFDDAEGLVRLMRADADVNNLVMLAVVEDGELPVKPVWEMTEEERQRLLARLEPSAFNRDDQNHLQSAISRTGRYFDAGRWD